jgi:hypothetical protein
MVRRQQAADRALRLKLRSPGHPKFQRPVEVEFWVEIANAIFECIEVFYNLQRRHSALSYATPHEYDLAHTPQPISA